MATRRMTFSLPEDLARRLITRVAARDRSRFLATALERSLDEENQRVVRSCQLANQDQDASAIESEWDQINDSVEEPWSDAPPR